MDCAERVDKGGKATPGSPIPLYTVTAPQGAEASKRKGTLKLVMAADLDWNPPKGKGGTRPFSNPLLVRPELAKCKVCLAQRPCSLPHSLPRALPLPRYDKATTYDLPGPGHTYGKALERDREDAGAVVASWQVHVKNPQVC